MNSRPTPMAVTGFSLRTPLGDDVETITRRMLAGERAIAPNSRFSAQTYSCQLAASITAEPKATKYRKFVKRMGLFGMEVGAEAFAKSGSPARGPRLGLFCGYGGLRAHWDDLMPVLENQDGSLTADGSWTNGFSLLHPFWMLFHLSNNAHALLSIQLGCTGDGTTTAGSNAGAQALRAAIAALEVGSIDTAIVFAYDSLVEPETILSLGTSGAATQASEATAVGAPYGETAAGFVPSEAAAALVLEKPEHATGRTLALLSASTTADGNAGFAAPSTMAQALAVVARNDKLVDGAGVGQRDRDAAERLLVANILGSGVPLMSTTANLGQMGAATPLVQTLLLMHFLSQKTVPAIAGLSSPTPGPLRPLVKSEATDARSAVALSCGMPGLVGAVRVELP
ncbi:MAG TPA: beta-ketoacyl synthase N-terminal-like domain-containing protein [Polyangium sp.]|nr:beta-ketoacyl synthase N-terminal-like domain-containing protein [Polyangium sp.]